MRALEEQLFPVFVDCSVLYKRSFFSDFVGETPLMKGLEEARLDAVSTACN